MVAIEKKQAEIVIPLTALQTVEGQTIVFVQHEDGDFEAQAVQTGRRDFQQVEIIQGLKSGQTYVSQNAFTLKAQMQKGEFSEGHSH
jgi:cobalt-zinc-cadmium efflux system membrane fusion protein